MKKFVAVAVLAITGAAFAQDFDLIWTENTLPPDVTTDSSDPIVPDTAWSGDLSFDGASDDIVWNAHEITMTLTGPGAAGAQFYNHALGGDQRSPGLEPVFPAIAYDTYNIPRPGNAYLQSPANANTGNMDAASIITSFSSPPNPATEDMKDLVRVTVIGLADVANPEPAFLDWSGQLSYIPGTGQGQQIVPVSGSLQIRVPEPASLSLLALAALGLIRRR